MTIQVSLLVPGLEGPAAGGDAGAGEVAAALLADLDVPGFAALMRHADVVRSPHRGETLGQMGAALIGWPSTEGDAFPAAALSKAAFQAGDDGSPARVWLRADPVHLRADMGKLIVFPPDVLSLSLDQSSRVLEWLMDQEHYAGPTLELVTATCWICAPQQAPGMTTTSPRVAYGANASEVIARGGNAAEWHALMNEIQMLLHECPVNEERERDGLAPINSVWFWGEGALPDAPPAPAAFDAVHSDDPVVVGAARVAGIAVTPVVGIAGDGARRLQHGHHLVALGDLELAARSQNLDDWRAALSALDEAWFAPLAGALDAGQVASVDLHVVNAMARARRARFWQRLRRGPAAAASLGRLREVLDS